MKTSRFIVSIVLLVVAGVLTFFSFNLLTGIKEISGAAVISLVVMLPLLIIFYIVEAAAIVGGIFSGFANVNADNKTVKIISIIILILFVALIGLNIWSGLMVFG